MTDSGALNASTAFAFASIIDDPYPKRNIPYFDNDDDFLKAAGRKNVILDSDINDDIPINMVNYWGNVYSNNLYRYPYIPSLYYVSEFSPVYAMLYPTAQFRIGRMKDPNNSASHWIWEF